MLSERDDSGIRTITLNRPDRLNAMNRQLIDDLARAVDDANADPFTSVIVLTGAGRAFCAGDDRRDHVHPESEDAGRDTVDAIQRATDALVFGAKPVVGAINGWAVGGGFEWAINCDFPIWAESARAFFPEVSLNLFVTGAVTSLLPALVGLNTAREMLFFGDRYDARGPAPHGRRLASRPRRPAAHRGQRRGRPAGGPATARGTSHEARAEPDRLDRSPRRPRPRDRRNRRRLHGSGDDPTAAGLLTARTPSSTRIRSNIGAAPPAYDRDHT